MDPDERREDGVRHQAERRLGHPVLAAAAVSVAKWLKWDQGWNSLDGLIHTVVERHAWPQDRLRDASREVSGRLPDPGYLVVTSGELALFPFRFGPTTTLGEPRAWPIGQVRACRDPRDPFRMFVQVEPDRRPLKIRVLNDGPSVRLLLSQLTASDRT